MRSLLHTLLFLATTLPLRATTYYVANFGSDQAAGTTPATAWQTVAFVNAHSFLPGDTILFRRGDLWREVPKPPTSGTSSSPITFSAFGSGPRPVFNGAVLVIAWVAVPQSTLWSTPVATSPNQVFFNAVPGTRVASLSALTSPGQWYWRAGALYVSGSASPSSTYTSPGVEASAQNSAIDTNNQSYLVFDSLHGQYSNNLGGGGIVIGETSAGIVVSSCELSWNYGNGVWIYQSAGGNLTITGNDIHDNSSGIYESQYTGGTAATPVLISHNTIHDNTGGDGIVIYGNFFTVDHNILNNNGRLGTVDSIGIHIFTGDDSADANFGQNNVISYNSVSGQKSNAQDGSGIEIDHYTTNNTVHHNLVYANYGPGIDIYDATHLNIFHNTSYGNSLNTGGLAPKTEISVATGGANLVQYITLANNLAYATCPGCSAIFIDQPTTNSPGLLSETNLWYAIATNWYSGAIAGSSTSSWNAQAFTRNDTSANPLFRNIAGGDFSLLSTSPGRNAGTPMANFSFSYAAPDIGSFPYYSVAANTATF